MSMGKFRIQNVNDDLCRVCRIRSSRDIDPLLALTALVMLTVKSYSESENGAFIIFFLGSKKSLCGAKLGE